MHKGYMISSLFFIALSLICLGTTIHEHIQDPPDLFTLNFLGALFFHAITALIACVLFTKARSKALTTGKGGRP